ncbi:MAG: phosphate ABC transporter ATP-binding protein [Rhodothermales bacterium]
MSRQRASLKVIHPSSEADGDPSIVARGLNVWFGDMHVLRDVDVTLHPHRINCIVGPSGSGKSTLIRSVNRMNDDLEGFTCTGNVRVGGRDVLDDGTDAVRLRTEVGMVFQKPCVFPRSIAENVLFGVQDQQRLSREERSTLVEENLRAASLWREVKHRLDAPAGSLSIGQQQRLCIARTLAVRPRIVLLDEPTSSLDPVSGRAIEELMGELKKKYTIVLVTHDIRQAWRVADHLIFLCDGRVIEQGPADQLFRSPAHEETGRYLSESYCAC